MRHDEGASMSYTCSIGFHALMLLPVLRSVSSIVRQEAYCASVDGIEDELNSLFLISSSLLEITNLSEILLTGQFNNVF